MTDSVSLPDEFFWGEADEDLDEPIDRPTSVYQAIASMDPGQWEDFCRAEFNCGPEQVEIAHVVQRAKEIDVCEERQPPVEVWLDDSGYHTVLVYSKEE